MANGHGGARTGSGNKKKALSDKILGGNPGKRKLVTMQFNNITELEGVNTPEPKEYLSAKQRDGKELIAREIYAVTWDWLSKRNCANLINPQLIEQYAIAVARTIQCEEAISTYGFLSKHPTSGNPIQSPYVAIAQTYLKQANNIWFLIYQVVKENCTTEFTGNTPADDVMEKLLSSRGL
jgi:hypothetical protein